MNLADGFELEVRVPPMFEYLAQLPEVRQRNSHIEWESITGMRDLLAHQYFRIDATQVRATIDKPLEKLGLVCAAELGE